MLEGCSLNSAKVSILGYCDDFVLVGATAQALTFFGKCAYLQTLYAVTPSKYAKITQFCL